jgi:predicted metalloprotease with PDZ domain
VKFVALPALAAAAILLAAAKPPPEQRPIDFRISTKLEKDGSRTLRMKMRFRGDADGETALFLPSSWAGSDELWRHIERLEIRGAGRLSGSYDAPVLHHKPGAKIRVRYRVASAWQSDPGFDFEKGRPMVRPDWFFVHGESVFASVGGRDAAPARFRWGRLPRGWSVASDLDHLKTQESTLANLIYSVAIGGKDLRVVTRPIGDAKLRVAVLGGWRFTPEALADVIEPIVEAEDAFWEEPSSPFLVAMAPVGDVPSGLSYSGTGRADAFSIASTGAFELSHATRFVGHEYMHSWVPLALGGLPEENQAADYWFGEGFADYLAAKVLLRSGIWSLEQYIADKNETLLRYGSSPARTANAQEVAERFWLDPAVQQVSYDRGHLLAAIMDSEIAEKTAGRHSLESVLRVQKAQAVGSPELATTLFARAMREQTGIDIAPAVERYAKSGAPVLLPEGLFGDCARVVAETRREFDRGYDAAATRVAGGVIRGVLSDTPAYAAGMRNGMKLVKRESGKIGDSTVEIAYRVSDGAGERVLTYLPQGKGEFAVQRLEMTAQGTEAEAGCRAKLGGRK